MKKMVSYRFIFYSVLTLAIFWGGHLARPELSGEFLTSYELWREPILAGIACGLGCALLGIYILLNRIVFVSLALAQGSGLGIFLLFWTCALVGYHLDHAFLPFLSGLSMAVCFAVLFSWLRKKQTFSEESLIGLFYVISAGLILIVGDRITQGRHDLDNLLFGNAVAVLPQDLILIEVVVGVILLSHLLFQKKFIYVSADPIFMQTKGVATRAWMLFLYLLISLGITVSLKTLGALPVFSLMLIPPFIALRSARSIHGAFIISLLIGMFLPPLAYFYSYLFNFPTGASLILVSLFYLGASLAEGALIRPKTA